MENTASKAKEKEYTLKEYLRDSNKPKSDFPIGKAVFFLLGGTLIIGGCYYLYKKSQAEDENGKLAESLETQQATLINSILNNSFLNVLYLPQTDADKLIALAKQIKNWDGVQQSYKTLFGDNLAEYLSKKLTSANWQKFIDNLAVKGQPQNGGGTTIITPNVPSAAGLAVNDSVYLNWAGKASINMYTASTDYPQKPIVINKPASINTAAFGKILRIDNIKYVGSSVSMPLAQVQVPAGNKLWIRVADLSKVRVLGFTEQTAIGSTNFLALAI